MTPVTVHQARFLDALVDYLVGHEAMMSIKLQAGSPDAQEWARVRATTPLHGYYPGPSGRARARQELKDFFGWSDEEFL